MRIDSPMVQHYIISGFYVKPRDRDEIKLPIITYTLLPLDGLGERRETGGWYTYWKIKEIQESPTLEYDKSKYKLIYNINQI